MNLYIIKCLMFKKYKDIKIKCETDEKTYLYSHRINCSIKQIKAIDIKELIYLLKGFKMYIKQCQHISLKYKKERQ